LAKLNWYPLMVAWTHAILSSACPACEGGVWNHSALKCAYRMHFRTIARQENLGASSIVAIALSNIDAS